VSLYNPHIATMEADPTKAYNQDDATGFRLDAFAPESRGEGAEERCRMNAIGQKRCVSRCLV
jgi:hypothetical protein